jgi:hypothetical protein
MSLNEKHFSLDIETLGISPEAKILSIGCTEIPVAFSNFYVELDLIGQETVQWWKTQSDRCYDLLSAKIPLKVALILLKEYLQDTATPDKQIIIWCNGTDFDLPILTHAYRSINEEPPWKYNAGRDLRTLNKILGSVDVHNPMPHNALQDAIVQARLVAYHLDKLGYVYK